MSRSEENKVIIDGQTYYGGLNQPNLKFIKVNVDCWEKIFDFLSLRDILAMSQTCQRMRQIGGHYFRENFHGTVCCLSESTIWIDGNRMERDDFLRFIDTILIFDELELFTNALRRDLLGSLTTLQLYGIDLNRDELHGLENIKTAIETIDMRHGYIVDDSVGEFLASCTKLKSLRFDCVKFGSTQARVGLFQRTYPTLEYFECRFREEISLDLISLLKQNPNIKTLRIGTEDLCERSTFKLDCLNIENDQNYPIELLKTLYKNGCYKTLRVLLWTVEDTGEGWINDIISFNALEVLYTDKFFENICQLIDLQELQIREVPQEFDLEPVATNLINLERLWIRSTHVGHILPFLQYSKTLKMVIMDDRKNPGETSNPSNALNLFTLNKLRQISEVKRKVRIGVFEELYLATKWSAKHTNYDLVEITRAETICEHFDYKDHQ